VGTLGNGLGFIVYPKKRREGKVKRPLDVRHKRGCNTKTENRGKKRAKQEKCAHWWRVTAHHPVREKNTGPVHNCGGHR